VWHRCLVELLHRAKRSEPGDLPRHVNAALEPVQVDMTIYFIDYEQLTLHPLPEPGRPVPRSIEVEGTEAGQAFMTTRTVNALEPGSYWLPMIDGSERLGVVYCVLPRDHGDRFVAECETFVGLMGHLATTKLPYGDALHRTRRTQTMSPSGELLLSMLPPLTFHCSQVVVSAILEPAYDVGGDTFDYALDGTIARFVVLDAMGRGLGAALTSATALSAIRASRRGGDDLASMAKAAHDAICAQFSDMRFATGVLSELELDTGILRYVNAGHPPAVLLRGGKVVKELNDGGRVPLGLFDQTDQGLATEQLMPGDRLLFYTDGVVEARDDAGQIFGLDRLINLIQQHSDATLPMPEVLRRLSHSVMQHQNGSPSDDATMMLVDWPAPAQSSIRGY
jgi:hypothetical protein